MKNRIREENHSNVEQTIEVINSEWEEISMELIITLVLSFRKRLLLCCLLQGKQIGPLLSSYKDEDIEFHPMVNENLFEVVATKCADLHDVEEPQRKELYVEEDQLLLKLYSEFGPRWA